MPFAVHAVRLLGPTPGRDGLPGLIAKPVGVKTGLVMYGGQADAAWRGKYEVLVQAPAGQIGGESVVYQALMTGLEGSKEILWVVNSMIVQVIKETSLNEPGSL